MANFVFVLGTGPENPSPGTRCMQLASVAQEEGHKVDIFLVDNGVFYGKKGMAENIVAPTGDDMSTHLEKLKAANVPIYL